MWGDLEPLDTPSTYGRRDSTQQLFGGHFPGPSSPEYRDVTVVGDYIITTMPYGFDFWLADTEVNRRNPQYVTSVSGYSPDFDYATWQGVVGENNRVFERGDAMIVGNQIVYVQVGKHGLAMWKMPNSGASPVNNRTLLYQEWDGSSFRKYRDVELAQVDGRLYAYVTSATLAVPAAGVHVFDVTSALGLSSCIDNLRTGSTSCGVYEGSFSANGGQSLEVGISGSKLVYNSNFGRVFLYDLATDPTNPAFLGELASGSLLTDIFTNRLGQVGVVTRIGDDVLFWDVTACATSGDCSPIGTEVLSLELGSYLDERSMALESNEAGVERDFVYVLERSGCPGRDAREHLFEVSDLSNISDRMPKTAATFTDDGQTSTVSYSGWYNMGSLATGFRQVLPWSGAISGKYFYRVQRALFDVHELIPQVPTLTLSGPTSSFIGDSETYQVNAANCDAAASTFDWTIPPQGDATPAGPQARDVTWLSEGTWQITVSASGDCSTAPPVSIDVTVADPSPEIQSLTVNGQPLPAAPPYEALVCDQLNFAAAVSGRDLAYDWQLRDGKGAPVAGGSQTTLSWDTVGAVAPETYTLDLLLTNTGTSETDQEFRSIALDEPDPITFDGSACGGASGPCLTQGSPGSGSMTLYANTVNAAEWRWQARLQGTSTWQTLVDFGDGLEEQPAALDPGDWEIRVTARRCQDEITSDGNLTVTVDTPPIAAFFEAVCPFFDICEFVPPRTVNFTDSSTGDIQTWEYDFLNPVPADPSACNFSSTEGQPLGQFSFQQPGVYHPCLRITNGGTSDIYVHDEALTFTGITPVITVTCEGPVGPGAIATCSASAGGCSPGADEWVWTASSGEQQGPSGDASLQIRFDQPGVQTVTANNRSCLGSYATDNIVVLSAEVFEDGFDSGGTAAWSVTTP